MNNIEEESSNSCHSHNQETKEVSKEVNSKTTETIKTLESFNNIFQKNKESCHSSIVEISNIKENINFSINEEAFQTSKIEDSIKYNEHALHKKNTNQQELNDINGELLTATKQEYELQMSDSSCIDFDIIFNSEYDLKDTEDGSINDSEHAITTNSELLIINETTPIQNNSIVIYPIVPIQTNQSTLELDFHFERENTTTPLRRFKKKLTILFNRIKDLKIFSKKFLFIWNLIALLPFILVTNKVIFSQMCLISTFYESEKKNYTFVLSAIIVMLFSNDSNISLDSYDKFFTDAELRKENVFNTTKKKVYYLSEWDFSHLPENPTTQEGEIGSIMEEMQTKFKTFDFLMSQNITINGSVKRSIMFQVKKKVGTTNLKIINLKTDKFINNNIKKGVEMTARLLPAVIVVEKHIYVFFMGKSIKIEREMNLNIHMIFIFYPHDLVSYLERIMLSQVPIPRNSINRYINAHLLNECDLYFLNL